MKTALALLFLGMMVGCMITKPAPIPGYHWSREAYGCALYNDATHEKAASLVMASLMESAQICDFERHGGCHNFETTEDAVSWIRQRYTLKLPIPEESFDEGSETGVTWFGNFVAGSDGKLLLRCTTTSGCTVYNTIEPTRSELPAEIN